MRPGLTRQLEHAAGQREQAGLTRRRRLVRPLGSSLRVELDGRELIDFSSNDYLGLGQDACPSPAERASASASPLICGYHSAHQALEKALAEFTGFPACALFPSGYQANLAVGQALAQRGEGALADRLNHASLNDGLRLAGARIRRYAHGDLADAARRASEGASLIVSDSVFSMDGDLAPLVGLADLADQHDLALWLDDAHGFGLLGESGRGTLELAGLDPERVDVYVATFGKALGSSGAFVAGQCGLIEHLENSARGLIYSTALSPALAEWTLAQLERLQAEPWRRDRLGENLARFRAGCTVAGVTLHDSSTAIQILPIGDNRRAVACSAVLAEAGFLVQAIRPPTVPPGSARLRITLSAAHSSQDIDRLCATLGGLPIHARNATESDQ